MRHEDKHRQHRGAGGWEPANDAETRRWHDHHHDDEERGPRPRGRGRARHFGGPEFGLPPVPGFPGGPGMHGFGPWMKEGRGMRGTRARRGDVRAAALALIAEQPMNGYQIIQEIGERSGGVWRPSPGSIYPALQQLEDEGLIRAESGDGGRRAYQLTEEGGQYARTHADELRAPWEDLGGPSGHAIEMRSLLGQVAMAAFQVVSAGTDAQAAQARQVLINARKSLYRILAADDDEDTSAEAASGAGE